MTVCSNCKIKQLRSEFSPDRRRPCGLRSWCKSCCRKRGRGHYETNRERIAIQQKEYSQTKKGKEVHRAATQKQQAFNPEKKVASSVVYHAVQIGELRRSICCESCGLPAKTDGHHEDYNKPLEVDWLCRRCHIKLRRTKVLT